VPILADLISQGSEGAFTTPVYCPGPKSARIGLEAGIFIITLEQDYLYCQLITGENWTYSENLGRDFSLSFNYKIPHSAAIAAQNQKLRHLVGGLNFLADEKITGFDLSNEASNESTVVFIEPIWIESKYL
jgi:hypothetical protein